jgi:hypothetical protein
VYPAPSKEWKTKVIFGARPKLVYADDLDDDKAPLLVGRCWWKPWTWKYPKRVKAPEGHHWSEDRLDPGPSDPRHEEESEFCHECGEKICGLDLGAIVLTVEGGTGYYMVCGKCAKKVGGDEKKG